MEPRPRGERPQDRERRIDASMLAVVIVLATLGSLFFVHAHGRTRPGLQLDSIPAKLALASRDGWHPLVADGGGQPGFPEPMVTKNEQLCVGFSRVDFGPDDVRPTRARCISTDNLGELASNAIVTLATVLAGPDTWHFVEASHPLRRVRVQLASGAELANSRVYLHQTTFALRVPTGSDLDRLEWSTTVATFRCNPHEAASRTALFCPAPDGSPSAA